MYFSKISIMLVLQSAESQFEVHPLVLRGVLQAIPDLHKRDTPPVRSVPKKRKTARAPAVEDALEIEAFLCDCGCTPPPVARPPSARAGVNDESGLWPFLEYRNDTQGIRFNQLSEY